MATNVAPFAPQTLKLEFSQTIGPATNVQNRLFYSFSGTVATTDCAAIAQSAYTAFIAQMAPLLGQHWTLHGVTCTDLGASNGAVGDYLLLTPGSESGTYFVPAGTCMVLHAGINRRYRGGKPRWFQSGFTQPNLSDDQTWNTTFVGEVEAAFNTFVTGLKGHVTNGGQLTNNVNLSLVDGYQWTEYTTSSGKINYRKDPIYRAQAVTDIIQDWSASIKVGSQRRRNVN
jgi:hypothetical protein